MDPVSHDRIIEIVTNKVKYVQSNFKNLNTFDVISLKLTNFVI